MYEFAEKVLLPKRLKQPGHLKFITRLHIVMFDVSVSNDKRKYIFGLPEVYWPNEKTYNTVIRMINHIIESHGQTNNPGGSYKKLA